MATAHSHPQANSSDARISLVSLALLFVAVVSIALVLVGIAVRGSTPLALIPGLVLGCVAILTLHR